MAEDVQQIDEVNGVETGGAGNAELDNNTEGLEDMQVDTTVDITTDDDIGLADDGINEITEPGIDKQPVEEDVEVQTDDGADANQSNGNGDADTSNGNGDDDTINDDELTDESNDETDDDNSDEKDYGDEADDDDVVVDTLSVAEIFMSEMDIKDKVEAFAKLPNPLYQRVNTTLKTYAQTMDPDVSKPDQDMVLQNYNYFNLIKDIFTQDDADVIREAMLIVKSYIAGYPTIFTDRVMFAADIAFVTTYGESAYRAFANIMLVTAKSTEGLNLNGLLAYPQIPEDMKTNIIRYIEQ